jgi:hypothetical protein
MQNARSTAAISRASEGYHFSHDALVTCKLPIGLHLASVGRWRSRDFRYTRAQSHVKRFLVENTLCKRGSI